VESGEVADRGLVVTGGESTPLLDLVDAAFHRVAFAAELGVMGEESPQGFGVVAG
jgi:hypothetical protein